MKKLGILFITLIVGVMVMAQDRVVYTTKTQLGIDVTAAEYIGLAADTLTVNQDSIKYTFSTKLKDAVEKIVFSLKLDSLAGNDSIYYTLTGYNQLGGTGTSLATGGMLVSKKGELVDIAKVYNASTAADLSFRFYDLLLKQDDNASYNGGAKVQRIFLKIFTK
jgi:hypothetical protein